MIERVWVVEGMAGEYSDHDEWPVAFYLDEATARKHVELAAARYREIAERLRIDDEANACNSFCVYQPSEHCDVHKDIKNQWDPSMRSDYSGTNYRCYFVDVGPLAKEVANGKEKS